MSINNIVADKWIEGRVVKGEGRGKTLGFPTINLKLKTAQHLVLGVYSCKIKIKNKDYKGLLHYGPKPTFNDPKLSLEIYVLGFNQTLKKGKIIKFKLLKYLRKIKRFKSKNALKEQIEKDIKTLFACKSF